MIDFNNREEIMVRMYGEVTSKRDAAKILSVSTSKIKSMVNDGRIEAACAGTMIDVRSLARYIAEPKAMEEIGRINRIKAKNDTRWAI